jgi:antitoxin FitA
MPVGLDIPDGLAARLRQRAAEHRRSLDEEVVDALEASLRARPQGPFTQLLSRVRALGVHTPAEAAQMVREDRDGGHRD